MRDLPDRRPRSIAVWTATGTRTWVEEAYRRIYERELLARLPDARIQFACSLAGDAVLVSERGDLVVPLAAATRGKAGGPDALIAAGAAAADLVALASDLAVGPSARVTPCAVSALAMDSSAAVPEPARRLLAAAVDVSVRHGALDAVRPVVGDRTVAVVADPLVLLRRLAPPIGARSRLEYLRAMDGYPLEHTVLVEVSSTRAGHLAAIGRHQSRARARGHRIVVVVRPMEGEPMTPELRACVERAIDPVHCLDALCFDDHIATVAAATAVVPLTSSLLAAACAFGRPSLWCAEALWNGTDALAALPGAESLMHEQFDAMLQTAPNASIADGWCASLDAHFDSMAVSLQMAQAHEPRTAAAEPDSYRRLEAALRSTGRRVSDERLRFARRTEGLLAEIAQLRRERARQAAVETALREEAAGALAHAMHLSAQADLNRDRLRHMDAAERTLDAQSQENRAQADVVADLVRQRDELLAAVERFAGSRSWRYTAPGRALGRWVRRWIKGPT